jgi:hypothetical protein
MSRYTRDDNRYWAARPADHNAAGLFVDGPQMAGGSRLLAAASEPRQRRSHSDEIAPEILRTLAKLPRHVRALAHQLLRARPDAKHRLQAAIAARSLAKRSPCVADGVGQKERNSGRQERTGSVRLRSTDADERRHASPPDGHIGSDPIREHRGRARQDDAQRGFCASAVDANGEADTQSDDSWTHRALGLKRVNHQSVDRAFRHNESRFRRGLSMRTG